MLQSNECGEGSPRHCWQEWLYSNETLCLCMCADSNPPAHPLQDLWKSRLYITPSSLSVLLHPLLVVESCPISSRRMDTSTTKNTGTSSFLKGKAQCKLIEINGCRNRMSRIPCTIKIERLGCFSRWKRDTGVLLQRGAVLRGPAIGSPTAVPDRERATQREFAAWFCLHTSEGRQRCYRGCQCLPKTEPRGWSSVERMSLRDLPTGTANH